MKKKISQILAMLLLAVLFSSCATVLGGRITACQRTIPAPGQPSREIRGAALIADIVLFWPGAIIDFATGAIYRPCDGNYHSYDYHLRNGNQYSHRERYHVNRD